jgi:hypothetical protein
MCIRVPQVAYKGAAKFGVGTMVATGLLGAQQYMDKGWEGGEVNPMAGAAENIGGAVMLVGQKQGRGEGVKVSE